MAREDGCPVCDLRVIRTEKPLAAKGDGEGQELHFGDAKSDMSEPSEQGCPAGSGMSEAGVTPILQLSKLSLGR